MWFPWGWPVKQQYLRIQNKSVIHKFFTLVVELSVEIGLHFKNILKLQNNIKVGLKAMLSEWMDRAQLAHVMSRWLGHVKTVITFVFL